MDLPIHSLPLDIRTHIMRYLPPWDILCLFYQVEEYVQMKVLSKERLKNIKDNRSISNYYKKITKNDWVLRLPPPDILLRNGLPYACYDEKKPFDKFTFNLKHTPLASLQDVAHALAPYKISINRLLILDLYSSCRLCFSPLNSRFNVQRNAENKSVITRAKNIRELPILSGEYLEEQTHCSDCLVCMMGEDRHMNPKNPKWESINQFIHRIANIPLAVLHDPLLFMDKFYPKFCTIHPPILFGCPIAFYHEHVPFAQTKDLEKHRNDILYEIQFYIHFPLQEIYDVVFQNKWMIASLMNTLSSSGYYIPLTELNGINEYLFSSRDTKLARYNIRHIEKVLKQRHGDDVSINYMPYAYGGSEYERETISLLENLIQRTNADRKSKNQRSFPNTVTNNLSTRGLWGHYNSFLICRVKIAGQSEELFYSSHIYCNDVVQTISSGNVQTGAFYLLTKTTDNQDGMPKVGIEEIFPSSIIKTEDDEGEEMYPIAKEFLDEMKKSVESKAIEIPTHLYVHLLPTIEIDDVIEIN